MLLVPEYLVQHQAVAPVWNGCHGSLERGHVAGKEHCKIDRVAVKARSKMVAVKSQMTASQ